MKTTVVLFAAIFGFIIPTYSQLNRHRKVDATSGQPQERKTYDFGNYEFDKFTRPWRNLPLDRFKMLPIGASSSKLTGEMSSAGKMPCFHPKSGDKMPCFKPADSFPMRVFNPENVIWGMLW
jgi:hypothetical protein